MSILYISLINLEVHLKHSLSPLWKSLFSYIDMYMKCSLFQEALLNLLELQGLDFSIAKQTQTDFLGDFLYIEVIK